MRDASHGQRLGPAWDQWIALGNSMQRARSESSIRDHGDQIRRRGSHANCHYVFWGPKASKACQAFMRATWPAVGCREATAESDPQTSEPEPSHAEHEIGYSPDAG